MNHSRRKYTIITMLAVSCGVEALSAFLSSSGPSSHIGGSPEVFAYRSNIRQKRTFPNHDRCKSGGLFCLDSNGINYRMHLFSSSLYSLKGSIYNNEESNDTMESNENHLAQSVSQGHEDKSNSINSSDFSTTMTNLQDNNATNLSHHLQPFNRNGTAIATKRNILQMINPYNAGKSLRSTVQTAISLASAIASSTSSPASRLSPDRRAIYYNFYLDDKLGLSMADLKDSTKLSTDSLSFLGKDYRPEVLVVGATGALGRILVKRLLIENKTRIRVLVRDLYSSTLNKLGTGVTYCQGDLNNIESLEYAVTDVDKIIFCAAASQMQHKNENWENLETKMSERARQAEMVDITGLRNLIHAYQNVRHADYGSSQTAKRVLFKFGKRSADFNLFSIDDGSLEDDAGRTDEKRENTFSQVKPDPSIISLLHCSWKRNKFGHGVFTGQVRRYAEAAIVSARLRSRNKPDEGIDFRSSGYGGIVCRVCSNGGVYEAFVRTEAYERLGVEYVCEFRTASKSPSRYSENSSRDKFSTIRLDFPAFRARMRPEKRGSENENTQRMRRVLGKNDIPPFTGRDVRQLGFRYRGENNSLTASNPGWSKFYFSLDYIKAYRGQPEPEFVYLSDARIPPVVHDGIVRDDLHRLLLSTESGEHYKILDQMSVNQHKNNSPDRSAEETYFKYKGEEIIKKSGLSYTIIRVAGYNESPSTDSSAIRLQKTNKDITAVSRADLAQVISSALLEPNACNLVLYMTKARQRGVSDGDIWQKFARLQAESQQEQPFQ